MFSFISKIFSNIGFILTSPVRLTKWFHSFYNHIIDSVKSFLHHLKILREANISLGKYHIQNRNFRDASIRFWIVDKFIAPNDDENNYWYAWSYIFRGEYIKALKKLNDNTYDKRGLGDYIQNLSTTETIPKRVYDEYNSLSENYSEERYFDKKKDAYKDYIEEYIKQIMLKSEGKQEISILEIGTKFDILSTSLAEIDDRNQDVVNRTKIDGVNFNEVLHFITKEFNQEVPLYNSLKLEEAFKLSKNTNKYDIIASFDNLSFTLKIEEHLKKIKGMLKENGSIIILLPQSDLTKIEPLKNSYIYDQKFVEEKFKLADLTIDSIKTVNVNKQNNYHLIIAK